MEPEREQIMSQGAEQVRFILGLDIGSNSVGSAWVDTDKQEVHLAASVFPAGVDEQENKRGAPKNQARRQTRAQRRTIDRRAKRKRVLTRFLMEEGFLPCEPVGLQKLFDLDPWALRRKALKEPLTPHEFGRIVIHLAQRRGAVGVVSDPENPDEGKVKEGMDRMNALLAERGAATVGQLLADLMDERRQQQDGVTWNEPIRNRQYRLPEAQQLFAGRDLIRKEFQRIVEAQRAFEGSGLSGLLTDELVKRLDDPTRTDTWRQGGLLFGQRRTYWDTGTLGRCVLEPTERCVPEADMYAQEFRVVEYVNNLRVRAPFEDWRSLTAQERDQVIAKLRAPLLKRSKGQLVPKKSASMDDIREALGVPKTRRKGADPFEIRQESQDPDRPPNTDWFYREVVHQVFSEPVWTAMEQGARDIVNKALLKLDPDQPDDAERVRFRATGWWGLDDKAAARLVEVWKSRPKLERRLKLSRRAIRNLLPYMNRFSQARRRWPTQIEARQAFAEDRASDASPEQRRRYLIGAPTLTKADRRFLRKHPDLLPPAPMMSNPVVRKAIHEVRRVLIAWRRRMGCWPDQVVLEYTRSATQPEKVRNEQLALNRKRDRIKDGLREQFNLRGLAINQQERAIQRVVLCRQQRGLCAYTGTPISEKTAAEGTDVEIDHIVPRSRSQDNGLNNKVLVLRTANRGKGNQTVKEWLPAEAFAALEQRLQHFQKGEPVEEYSTGRDYARKWENLHRDAPSTGEFLSSQFTDTAYATRQVGQWIRDALYDGERDGRRHVFTTKGPYTAILRKDWGLLEDLLDQHWRLHAVGDADEAAPAAESKARREKGKDRSVHLHHAIDAVAIALAPRKLQELAARAEAEERARALEGRWPRSVPLAPPWPSLPHEASRDDLQQAIQTFRDQVVGAAQQIVVCHRPVKRRLVDKFHEETHYGPVIAPLPCHRTEKADSLFTNRISADRLTPNHLRVPDEWDELSARLDDPGVLPGDKKALRRQLAALVDPSPGKSGIVRDRALRDRIRKCLRGNALDPDSFTAAEIKKLVGEGKLTMGSGVPIKGVVLLRTNADPVIIPRKRWDPTTNRMIRDDDPRTARVYIGGNNHHMEIRQNRRRGRWSGVIIPTFEAARRVRLERRDAVERVDNDDSDFVMSLAEGEMIYARRKDRPPDDPAAVGYFVVCKLDKPARIHFAPHWDARKASEQDRWDVTPGDLKNCGPEPGVPAYKVRVSPLGEVRRLEHD